jgi:hypothetical protein
VVTSTPGGHTGSGNRSPVTVKGLSNDVSYTFAVKAVSVGGEGAPSSASAPVTPRASPPHPPLPLSATPGYNSAVIEFAAPVFKGNSPITSYTVVVTDVLANGGADPTPASSSSLSSSSSSSVVVAESPLTAVQTYTVGERSPITGGCFCSCFFCCCFRSLFFFVSLFCFADNALWRRSLCSTHRHSDIQVAFSLVFDHYFFITTLTSDGDSSVSFLILTLHISFSLYSA